MRVEINGQDVAGAVSALQIDDVLDDAYGRPAARVTLTLQPKEIVITSSKVQVTV